ncbi:MAG TPA: alpha/beta hydrolase [Negativicutes bacterium]|nr:alpha/beta hydrolase [Negativicutes bacterium]
MKTKKVLLMGLSLGGWLAVNYTIRHQDSIKKLVVLCPSGIGRARASFLFRSFPFMLMGNNGIDCVTRIVYGSRDVPKEVLEYSRILSKAFNLRKEPIPIFKDNELSRLTIPVMVLAGDKDALLHSDETISRIKQVLPQADARLLPKTGHALLNMTDIVLSFLLK